MKIKKKEITRVISNPRFCGLWSYMPHDRPSNDYHRFCCTVIVNGRPLETPMFTDWQEAIKVAGRLLLENE